MLCNQCAHRFVAEDIKYYDGRDSEIYTVTCPVCGGLHYLTMREIEED